MTYHTAFRTWLHSGSGRPGTHLDQLHVWIVRELSDDEIRREMAIERWEQMKAEIPHEIDWWPELDLDDEAEDELRRIELGILDEWDLIDFLAGPRPFTPIKEPDELASVDECDERVTGPTEDQWSQDARALVRHAGHWLWVVGLKDQARILWSVANHPRSYRLRTTQLDVHKALYTAGVALRSHPSYSYAMPAGVALEEMEKVFNEQSFERRIIDRVGGLEYLRALVRHEPREYGVELHAWDIAVRAKRLAI